MRPGHLSHNALEQTFTAQIKQKACESLRDSVESAKWDLVGTLKGGVVVAKGTQCIRLAVRAAQAEEHNLVAVQGALQSLVQLHCPSLSQCIHT